MSEPRTEAGKALLRGKPEGGREPGHLNRRWVTSYTAEGIAAIEAEAAALERRRLRSEHYGAYHGGKNVQTIASCPECPIFDEPTDA